MYTRVAEEEHTKKLEYILQKLESEFYGAGKKEPVLYQKEALWLEHALS